MVGCFECRYWWSCFYSGDSAGQRGSPAFIQLHVAARAGAKNVFKLRDIGHPQPSALLHARSRNPAEGTVISVSRLQQPVLGKRCKSPTDTFATLPLGIGSSSPWCWMPFSACCPQFHGKSWPCSPRLCCRFAILKQPHQLKLNPEASILKPCFSSSWPSMRPAGLCRTAAFAQIEFRTLLVGSLLYPSS